ncbi:hypothetical protein REPUB_Repub15cG0068000 [Reevesia pubescens]
MAEERGICATIQCSDFRCTHLGRLIDRLRLREGSIRRFQRCPEGNGSRSTALDILCLNRRCSLDKKPDDQSAAHINLKVKGQDDNEVFFRIKRSTQLKKLRNAYCDRQSADFNSIAFLFDDHRLRGKQILGELEMEDGAKPGTQPSRCTTCGGQGQVVSSARIPLGVFQQVMTCSSCDGAREISTPCSTCCGDGRVRRTKRIGLKLPADVDSSSRLRVRFEENAGRRCGSPGDLFVVIDVIPDLILKHDDTNILYTCKVSYIDAILGTTIKVPTVDDMVGSKIPAGTQPNTTLVTAKNGVRVLNKNNMRGD